VAFWLVKSEPGEYAYRDLERDGETTWSGVHNALALQHLRRMRPRDALLFYHSGAERAVVGIARVASPPRPDPDDARGSWVVTVRPVARLAAPVALATLRADPALAELALLRISRLSVMPVTPAHWERILRLGSPRPAAGHGTPRGRRSNHRAAARRNRGAT
jgi:predicted RNA-binding protein with PUA-like domain